jgi:DNA polymerase-3 subunit gamma/tau
MQVIMAHEDMTVSDEAYHQIALAAEGGMRDALSLLDQAISYSDGEVTLEDVLQITGSVSQAKLQQLTAALADKDVSIALSLVDQFIQEGKDPGRLIHDLIYFLRDALMYRAAPTLADQLERAIPDEAFKELANRLDPHWIQQAISEWNHCQQEMKWTTSPKVFIEISVLKLTEEDQASSVANDSHILQLTEKLGKLEKELRVLKEQGIKHEQSASPKRQQKRTPQSKSNYKIPFEKIRLTLEKAEKEHLQNVQRAWANVLQQVKQKSAPAHATLQDAKPAAASFDNLVIAFKYDIHCSLALEHRELIEAILLEATGHQMSFIPIPEEAWLKLREDFIKEQKLKAKDSGEKEEPEEEIDPVVEEARKLVGDDLLEIHED